MFCGECGRRVSAKATGQPTPQPRQAQPEADLRRPAPDIIVEAEPAEAELVEAEPVELVPVELVPVEPDHLDQHPVEPDPGEPEPVEPDPAEPDPVEPDPVEPEPVEPESVEQPWAPRDAADELDAVAASGLRCEQCGAPVSREDIFCGECGFVTRYATAHEIPIETAPPALPAPNNDTDNDDADSDDADSHEADSTEADNDEEEDVDETRLVRRKAHGERFVLQFSTGDSFTVYGTGLLGRRPLVEPGEFVDHLVTIVDPEKSVSKTHLEFGQENGAFWVSDRYSANGSVVREPDAESKRCDPGKRYRIVRGTRVDIGEQFFIVS